jgi:hypothetical protein
MGIRIIVHPPFLPDQAPCDIFSFQEKKADDNLNSTVKIILNRL